ncbi:uncharacterized protein CLUP02_18118 [Colletotrichum lupini]|uniref:Uncharacterized protein n=1 Tax=Colletotrichum lupini TaxID=145971 RepID=A0A9Q8SG69_9PEZI|nr:uncharacterized protein CLUP02_18118 [Colletotrichum lupini]UQC76605.1 hypothetical protein CLUP02_18118 [Colletotrichum lupini]
MLPAAASFQRIILVDPALCPPSDCSQPIHPLSRILGYPSAGRPSPKVGSVDVEEPLAFLPTWPPHGHVCVVGRRSLRKIYH